MRVALTFCLMLVAVHISSCSRTVEVNNASTPDLKPTETVAINSEVNSHTTTAQIPENKSPRNPKDVVLFDGKNYIKKSGWKVPSRKDAYSNETYDRSPVQRTTKGGKSVYTTTLHYIYKTPWIHSQDFYYEGRDLDYLNGEIESLYFMEISANSKVFMYTISGKKIASPPQPNSDYHEDPFTYRIQDKDGNGIFETLLYEDEIIVPDWVLK